MTSRELLAFLQQRGGQEYSVRLVSPVRSAKPLKAGKAKLHADLPSPVPKPLYYLTLRGEQVQAYGPSGQVRQLSQVAFLEVFGAYHFTELAATGTLTDLGPLFG